MMAPEMDALGFGCWARGFCNYLLRVSGFYVCADCGWQPPTQPPFGFKDVTP